MASVTGRVVDGVIMVPGDFATIQEAVDTADPGDTIMVAPGSYAGAKITTSVKIVGSGNSTIINEGVSAPIGSSGFYLDGGFGGGAGFDIDGTEISNLAITNVVHGILGWIANDISVNNVNITPLYQGIGNYNGSGWKVVNNEINSNLSSTNFGMGVASFFSNSFFGTAKAVRNNFYAFNKINFSGTGGNRHMGIFVGSFSGLPVEGNNFLHNEVAVNITPSEGQVVNPAAFSVGMVLLDFSALFLGQPISIKNNSMVGNDVSSRDPIVLRPPEVASVNYKNVLSENLGAIRSIEKRPDEAPEPASSFVQ